MSRTLHPSRTIGAPCARVKCYRALYREMLTTAAKLTGNRLPGLAVGGARR